ncbi:MAG: MFS transporter [Candidatus Bathyarchaeia archaeon]|jgi:EmrB/QacA subfamily drug resistance transporter
MKYKYVVLTNTTIGSFMSQLDSNIVLISLPTIIRELPGTTTFDALWVIMGYMLVTATLLLTFGRLADIYGRVRLYNLGFVVFTIGSALCSIAPNGISLVIFRLIQGVGGALIFSNNAAILTDAFPATERGRAIGINLVFGVSGSIIGLVAGGVLTATLGWRSIFWINIPVGIFATSWAYAKLKELSASQRDRLDPLGNILFAAGLSIFLVGMTLGAISGFTVIDNSMMILGLLMVVAFVYAETKVQSPMMDLTLFKIRPFSAGIVSNLLASISRGAVLLLLVFYFQGALLLDALTAGILLIPFSFAFVSVGPLSGYLSDKFGARGFSTGGLIVSAAALLWFATLPANVPYSILVLPMILAGIGGGMFVAPNISSVMNATPAARRGIAAGIASTMITTGFLLSLGVAFVIMATSMPLSTLQAVFAGLPVAANELNVNLFMDSMHRMFLLMAGMSLAAAIPSSMRGPKHVRA